ncbi:MAG: ATP-binding protein [Stenotrophomonas maltophilia]
MTLLVTATVGTVTAAAILREQRIAQGEMEAQAQLILNSLAVASSDSLYFSDTNKLSDLARRLEQTPNLLFARFYDREGRVIGDAYDIASVQSFETDPFGRELLQTEDTTFQWESHQLVVGQSVILGRVPQGAISIGLSTASLQARMSAIWVEGISAALVAASVGTLISLLISRSITRPIKELAAAAQRIGRGEFHFSPQARGNDELGALTRSFGDMTDRLIHLRDGLVLRTAELTKTAESLQTEMAERKQLEEQLLQSLKMESIGRLAGGIAHDFNNLLTAIIGYSELSLSKIPKGDPIQADLEEIQKAADRAASLTGQLLAFSRRQIIEPKLVGVNQLIMEVGSLLQRLIDESISLALLPGPSAGWVKVDPHQFEQVLINLVVNARDAMPEGGQLTVQTSNVVLTPQQARELGEVHPGEYVVLTISDTGTGMSAETQKQIFEPFFTTKDQGKGTGLGLATCYGIVKQNSGHIEVESELGTGTCFRIYLPRVEAPSDVPAVADEPEPWPRGTETVLLVEDEPAVRTVTSTALSSQGYRVLEATNGLEALQVSEDHAGEKISLLFTDVIMPTMGGKELAEQICERRPDIKVLFTSGYDNDAIADHGLLEPGLEFLQKPAPLQELTSRVRHVLDK